MTIYANNFDESKEVVSLAKAPQTSKFSLYKSMGKRVFDIALVTFSLPFAVPLIIFMALAVALYGGSPFYTQTRIGKNGRKFRMLKLRTMVHNADEILARYLDENVEARIEWNATQKLKNDPRITKIGRFLRKTSMDELPQIFNVLFGSMSLVGPRPMMVSQKEAYYGSAYFQMLPGITGFWQIGDRNESAFVGRVSHDEAYYREMSLATDLRVLVKTVSVVFRATGY